MKRLRIVLIMTSILLSTSPTHAAKLPDLRRHEIVRRVSALRKPVSALVRSCQDLLSRWLVRLPIDIEIRTNGMVMKGRGDISNLLTRAKYTQDQITRAHWSDVVEAEGVREIQLARAFPDGVVVRVDHAFAPTHLMIEGEVATNALVPAKTGVPVVRKPSQILIEAEIVADPENVSRLEKVRDGLNVGRDEHVCTVSQAEVFSYTATRDESGVGRFGGIGVNLVVVHLPPEMEDLLIFRAGSLLHGSLGPMPVRYVVRKLEEQSFDDERVALLKNFVATLPAARSITAEDLSDVVGTMSFSDGQLDAIRTMKSRMSDRDRRDAAIAAADFMSFDSDAQTAVRILLRD